MPKNKKDLINYVADREGRGQRAAEAMVNTVLAGISSLSANDRLTLWGFGSFKTSLRAARLGRNPRTGETIDLPATRSLTFRAAKSGS